MQKDLAQNIERSYKIKRESIKFLVKADKLEPQKN